MKKCAAYNAPPSLLIVTKDFKEEAVDVV